MSVSSSRSTVCNTSRARVLALMLTRRCNMTCAHCSVESGPQFKTQPSLEELRERVIAAAHSGVRSVLLTGGEPMLREKDVLALLREARRLGMSAVMASNGFWGTTSRQAARTLRTLRRAGLSLLTISYDRYHAAFQGPAPALHIARAAAAQQFPININITRAGGDADLESIVDAFESDAIVRHHVRLRFYDVQPVGRARQLEGAELRGEIEGFCGACCVPALTDDGRVTACNGPSYFAPASSPLHVGSLGKSSLEELIAKHAADPVLDTIRTFGPGRLRDELRHMSGFETFPFRERYAGMCQLCTQITSDERAVAALRVRLGQERFVAEREAKKRIINAERRGGTLDLFSVNGSERARVFLDAARGGPWPRDASQILGRADLDWRRTGEYLSNCGLARPLAARLDDHELARWAPPFFPERVRLHATRDALREFIAREILGRLDEVLQELDTPGVLLKGAALAARAGTSQTTRAAGDVDLWVAPEHAEKLRALLLARGFDGKLHAMRTGAHHLAPVFFRRVPLEIHTRLLPAFWGLPEHDMLAHGTPLKGFARLSALDREGSVLHDVVHVTTHIFSHGLKTAWDVSQFLQRPDGFDWLRLERWVEQCAAPRAFWVPFAVFCRELGLEAPGEFLSRAPHDAKQARLELIALRRAFTATDAMEAVNPFSKNAFFLMLCDTPRSRAKVLTSMVSREAKEARQSAWQRASEESTTPLRRQLFSQAREAWRQWRYYRRAIGSPQFRAQCVDHHPRPPEPA